MWNIPRLTKQNVSFPKNPTLSVLVVISISMDAS